MPISEGTLVPASSIIHAPVESEYTFSSFGEDVPDYPETSGTANFSVFDHLM